MCNLTKLAIDSIVTNKHALIDIFPQTNCVSYHDDETHFMENRTALTMYAYFSTWFGIEFKGSLKLPPLTSGEYCTWPLGALAGFAFRLIRATVSIR